VKANKLILSYLILAPVRYAFFAFYGAPTKSTHPLQQCENSAILES
jgi:hypothetical protein